MRRLIRWLNRWLVSINHALEIQQMRKAREIEERRAQLKQRRPYR